ncbi:helix-turn-helix transcriptional regulator [Nitrincola schmidtii]|uniref:helix-turn-helix transcriptional regulator n=1 Tax=Nitrincola schmidtii TaxID=1730894 RepID=UPI00124F36B3|nr:AlpA family phage regulatory protein [Nitrincola schmidtii]
MSNTLLRRHAVEAEIGFSRSTIYRLMDKGEFPKPIRLTSGSASGKGGSVAWLKSDIEKWKEDRIAESKKDADYLSKVHIIESQKDADRMNTARIAESHSAFGGDV